MTAEQLAMVEYVRALVKEARDGGLAALEVGSGEGAVKFHVAPNPPRPTTLQEAEASGHDFSAFELQQIRFRECKQQLEMAYAHTGGQVSDEEVWMHMGETPRHPRPGERADEEATVTAPEDAETPLGDREPDHG